MLPEMYLQLGKHVAAGTAFLSNIALLFESGYFDNSAVTKPLLHLWSLGIEEQFYLIYPLLLFFSRKLRIKPIATLVIIFLLSMTANIRIHGVDVVADFYSPLTRFWELIAGGIAACLTRSGFLLGRPNPLGISRRCWADVSSVAGFCMIGVSVVRLNEGLLFPGYWATLPVAGACFCIFAGPQALVNRIVLSAKPAVWVGLISYPLYLWHWPLLSLLRTLSGGQLSVPQRWLALGASVPLAYVTYRFVERPLRYGQNAERIAAVLLAVMVVIGCLGAFVWHGNGLSFRYGGASRTIFEQYLAPANVEKENTHVWAEKRRVDLMPFDTRDRVKVLVIGNSFSGDLINALNCSTFKDRIQIRSLTINGGCGNILADIDLTKYVDEKTVAKDCPEVYSYRNPQFLSMIRAADVIMIAYSWAKWEVDFLDLTLANFSKLTGAPVVICGSKSLGGLRTWVASNQKADKSPAKAAMHVGPMMNTFNAYIEEKARGGYYLDIQALMCVSGEDCPVFDELGRPISLDGVHLTTTGDVFLGKRLSNAPVLQKLLGATVQPDKTRP